MRLLLSLRKRNKQTNGRYLLKEIFAENSFDQNYKCVRVKLFQRFQGGNSKPVLNAVRFVLTILTSILMLPNL